MNFFESEAAFMSSCLDVKFMEGLQPSISLSELQNACQKFLQSPYYNDNHENVANFEFEDLDELVKNYHEILRNLYQTSEEGLVVKNDKIYPTIEFRNISSKGDQLTLFLRDERYFSFSAEEDNFSISQCDAEDTKTARIAARYLTEYCAKVYIIQKGLRGEWPKQRKDIESIFVDDLAPIFKLKGSKKFFAQFYLNAREKIARQLKEYSGKTVFSSNIFARDAYIGNYCQVFKGFGFLKTALGENYEDFTMKVQRNSIEFTKHKPFQKQETIQIDENTPHVFKEPLDQFDRAWFEAQEGYSIEE